MTARYLVRLTNGARLRAADIELSEGWLRALTIRTRVEVEDGADVGRPVVVAVRERFIPARRVRDVLALDGQDQA